MKSVYTNTITKYIHVIIRIFQISNKRFPSDLLEKTATFDQRGDRPALFWAFTCIVCFQSRAIADNNLVVITYIKTVLH